MTDEPRHGGMNEAVLLRADDQMIYFETLGMGGAGTFAEAVAGNWS